MTLPPSVRLWVVEGRSLKTALLTLPILLAGCAPKYVGTFSRSTENGAGALVVIVSRDKSAIAEFRSNVVSATHRICSGAVGAGDSPTIVWREDACFTATWDGSTWTMLGAPFTRID